MTERRLQVCADEHGMRLDRWLRHRFCGLPQGRIGKLLRTGKIRVDGRRAKVNARLSAGEQVWVPLLYPADRERSGPDFRTYSSGVRRFSGLLLYRDGSVLAINKPSGLAVQGGTGQRDSVDRMAVAWSGEAGNTPRLVHRIDRDTSGVLLLALNRSAAIALTASFRDRQIRKTYWAAVERVPSPLRGVITSPLLPVTGAGARRMRIASPGEPGAREAFTEYATLGIAAADIESEIGCAWLALRPHTGRTHQLRSHLAAIGCPILGDRRYGAGAGTSNKMVRRLCLHARSLIFPHPESGAMTVVCAPMDNAMGELWKRMRWKETDAPDDPFPLR